MMTWHNMRLVSMKLDAEELLGANVSALHYRLGGPHLLPVLARLYLRFLHVIRPYVT
ncbi:uncharacterized protein G2W53_031749 [Senna tora]|uniref:Uncharacterized protein n=1 Tax=Senna tora TaxID=362788 RepID=A0A834SUH0_9FABA|nr:uncharacterized protein G2W53_031749 [Senna tora]